MNELKEDSNLEMKAKVKANIYKTLLEEEKVKGRRKSTIGLSLFVVGVVSTSALHKINEIEPEMKPQVTQNNIKVIETHKNVPKYLNDKNVVEMSFLDDNFLNKGKLSTVKEEDFFVSDFKM